MNRSIKTSLAVAASLVWGLGPAAAPARADQSVGYVSGLTSLLDAAGGTAVATVSPGTPVTILARDGTNIEVRVEGWSPKGAARYLFKDVGVRIFLAVLGEKAVAARMVASQREDDFGKTWEEASVTGWLDGKAVASDIASVWDTAAPLYYQGCSRCHSLPRPSAFTANQWPSVLKIMAVRVGLDKEQTALVTALLQYHSRDQNDEDTFSQKVAADTTAGDAGTPVVQTQAPAIEGSPALAAQGKDVFDKAACAACHGEDAQTPILPAYPKLAGQNVDYLYKQILDFKSGARANDANSVMKDKVGDLSDDDIKAVAYYVSTLGGAKAAAPAAGPAKGGGHS